MTELEKLRNAETLIRDMSEGHLQIVTAFGNNIFVSPSDDTYIGLNMLIRGIYQQKCYKITFDANVQRMGGPMTAADLGKLATEVQQVQALLTALEMYQFHPTQEDMEQFRDYLLDKQLYGVSAPKQEAMNSQSM